MQHATVASYFAATTVWFWTYGTTAALLLVIFYHADLRERDRRLTHLRAVAQSAQIKALRYQLNPHFMFNTLNSIASLIGRKETEEAEGQITLSAGQTSVAPMEQIDLTGVYPGGEGAILQVQKFSGGAWQEFPVTAVVSNETFATFVQTSFQGVNRFRVVDNDTGVASNEVKGTVG